jgi:hypothetical protein
MRIGMQRKFKNSLMQTAGPLSATTLITLVWNTIKGSMEWPVVRLNILLLCLIASFINGCGFLSGDSYEEDFANDRKILLEILKVNPVLDSVPGSHTFFVTDAEYNRATGTLDLGGLGLNDSNFFFPKNIQDFRLVKEVNLSRNDFTELPRGARLKNWRSVLILGNKICNPSSETVTYLNELMKGFGGPYWRDTQHCSDSVSAVLP